MVKLTDISMEPEYLCTKKTSRSLLKKCTVRAAAKTRRRRSLGAKKDKRGCEIGGGKESLERRKAEHATAAGEYKKAIPHLEVRVRPLKGPPLANLE